MKESFKKYWIYYLAFIFFILGMFYYSKAYAYDHFAYDHEGNAYCFQHPLAIKHMDMYLEMQHIDMHQLRALAHHDCKTNAQKVQFYNENGERCSKDTKDRC